MKSLIFRGMANTADPVTFLCIRTHDLGGTDYERVATLTLDQARSVLAGTVAGVGSAPIGSHLRDGIERGATPGRLRISQRPDPGLETRNFVLELRREGQPDERLGYISADQVAEIRGMKVDVDFARGEPDFDGLEQKLKALRVRALREEANALEADLVTAIGQGMREDVARFVDDTLHPDATTEEDATPGDTM